MSLYSGYSQLPCRSGPLSRMMHQGHACTAFQSWSGACGTGQTLQDARLQAPDAVDAPQFIVGWHFHANALRVLRRGTANMDVLVSLGTNAAYIYSVVSVFHRRALHARGVEVDSMGFFETSALLITFISLGKYLEAHAKGKTSQVRG